MIKRPVLVEQDLVESMIVFLDGNYGILDGEIMMIRRRELFPRLTRTHMKSPLLSRSSSIWSTLENAHNSTRVLARSEKSDMHRLIR